MAKLIVVVIDGLNAACAQAHMAGMMAYVAQGEARYWTLQCGLPSLSRPLYATLLTGKSPVTLGIVSNKDDQPRALSESWLHAAHAAGKRTAVAGYGWFFELLVGTPFVPAQHRCFWTTQGPLDYGMFYHEDVYPDAMLLSDAAWLYTQWQPDVLLIHTMGVDAAGHAHGSQHQVYRQAVRQCDRLLMDYLPMWRAAGYQVCVTSDHGMHEDGAHNDVCAAAVREVPLWLLGTAWTDPVAALERAPEQRDIATLCAAIAVG